MLPPAADATSASRTAPPRDLAALLTELAVALQSHGTYPPGHPLLARSAEALIRRVDGLLQGRDTLSFGVARRQLVIEGVATDPQNALLGSLAGRLHRHRVGAVTLRRGIQAAEVTSLLETLSSEPSIGPGGRGEWRDAWPHVRLHSLTYAQLELVEGDGDTADDAPSRAEAARAAQLWVGLAQAALAADHAPEEAPEAEEVARAINEHPQARAYDQALVGYLLQLADELKHEGGGRPAAEVRRRMSRLVAGLSPEALRRLLEMGGDEDQRRRFLLDASRGFGSGAVVRLVSAAADAREQPISHSLLRLLSKLSAQAGGGTEAGSAAAEAALREQVGRLVDGWSLADPSPEAYAAALDRLSRLPAGEAAPGAEAHDAEAERIVQTALEVGAAGAATRAAVYRMAAGDGLPALVRLLEEAPEGSPLREEAWEAVCRPEHVRRLLRAGPDAAAALDRVVERMGAAAVPPLLDELAGSESRTVRRAALGRLAALDPAAVGAEAVRRLDDPRWFVVRNLLSLLGDTGAPPGFSPAPFTRHADARVRREAFKVAFRIAAERERALGLALTDADGQVQRLGLAECLADCPVPAVPLVCRRVEDPAADEELRLLAIRVLGGVRDPMALQTLLRLARGGRTLLGRVRLASRSPEMLAALAALAGGWAAHPEASPLVAVAMRSTDPDVLRAVLLQKSGFA